MMKHGSGCLSIRSVGAEVASLLCERFSPIANSIVCQRQTMRSTFVRNARKDQQVMDFELPEEHQLAYESAFAFARDEIRPHNAEIERSDDLPRWMWQRLADQGYTGIVIHVVYGGSDGDLLMDAVVFRGMGREEGALVI